MSPVSLSPISPFPGIALVSIDIAFQNIFGLFLNGGKLIIKKERDGNIFKVNLRLTQ
jgi:hypothetical protein